jgi:hypothetical protein
VGLHADGLDAHVRSSATRHLTQLRQDVDLVVFQRLRPDVRAHLLEPVLEPIDDDLFSTEQHGRPSGHLA